ncbi:hypothetical protein Alches_13820 [Alicyclobacillus hesperidum subsp. aegles]|uniref:Uncharacterized protein n=1 Tax=Alicyclobacillus hesperidum TaxID=89784 RepID=A0A1H2WBR8_9BACL|nr:hypothetical protein [Alicyclobacillus hesperidum]KRW91268.1 hypothetical protein SD51_09940 [Alicyclobacillus tengchongensis]GLG01343.1 hypothetical protein Alches_13820 [Alicyclobacillus hesperidum subsp. aegles]GLV14548.1 hypothetical protein Heshes_22320 [Alicyclobacillus hesperidum]SDW77975.1 hypothetical protein SAMN04489725_11447 [Alicyclobacillus hesperidum]
MQSRMNLGRRRRIPIWIMAVLGALVLLFMFEAYRLVMPFVSRNPLYHEVNFGQTVIDNWEYEGENEEGYLEFYNPTTGGHSMLPPSAKLFGADGKWVVIEHADAASLTYAEPLESAPPYWYLIMLAMIGGGFWWMMHRRRALRKKRMYLRGTRKETIHVPTVKRRPKRFRAKSSRRLW